MFFSSVCLYCSGSGFRDQLINHSEESYCVCVCVCVCSLESPNSEADYTELELFRQEKKIEVLCLLHSSN
jgi:hypothetical protein